MRNPFKFLPVSSTLHTALKDLVDDGVVETEAGAYRLSDPMFVRYINRAAARAFTLQRRAW